MKRVMMEIGLLVVGLSFAGLHTLVCYRLAVRSGGDTRDCGCADCHCVRDSLD